MIAPIFNYSNNSFIREEEDADKIKLQKIKEILTPSLNNEINTLDSLSSSLEEDLICLNKVKYES